MFFSFLLHETLFCRHVRFVDSSPHSDAQTEKDQLGFKIKRQRHTHIYSTQTPSRGRHILHGSIRAVAESSVKEANWIWRQRRLKGAKLKVQARRSAAVAGLLKSPFQYVKDGPRLTVWTCSVSGHLCRFNSLLSPQPASLGLSPCITQSGCHPGISAMFHVLACACTCTLPFRMFSQALTAPSSAWMCWSFGDPWYLYYLADCMWQRLVAGSTAILQCACECVGLCLFWGWQTKWSHGEALTSRLKNLTLCY